MLIPTAVVQAADSVVELAYVEFTANVNITATTEATADTIVSAGAVNFDGVTEVMIEFYADSIESPGVVGGRGTFIVFYEDADSIGTVTEVFNEAATAIRALCFGRRFLTPTAGSKTYSVRGFVTNGTGIVRGGLGGGGARMPGYIRIIQNG
jgi:hypothetical protein